jgi:hypothetical protein
VNPGTVVDNIDESALLTVLNGDIGYDQLIGQRVHEQTYIDELLREERVVLVVENRLELGRASCIIDLIIKGHQLAGCQFSRIIAIIGIGWQVHARSQLLRDLGEAILRNRKQNGNRLELGDHDHAGGIGSVNDVAGIHKAEA